MDDENYDFKTNVNRRLSEILEIPHFTPDISEKWNPPRTYGLDNCNVIIENRANKDNLLDVDYFEIIKDDIRNLRPLNEFKMEYIMKMEDEYKNELLSIFNNCIKLVVEILHTEN